MLVHAPWARRSRTGTALVFGDQLRVEVGLPVAWDLQIQLARAGDDRLAAVSVAAGARLLASEAVVHLPKKRRRGPSASPSSSRCWQGARHCTPGLVALLRHQPPQQRGDRRAMTTFIKHKRGAAERSEELSSFHSRPEGAAGVPLSEGSTS